MWRCFFVTSWLLFWRSDGIYCSSVALNYQCLSDYRVLQRKKFPKSEITMEVGGWVQVLLGFLGENLLKIALNQYWYFGVVYRVFCHCKSCWLLWFECSVDVSDGFQKIKVWMDGSELYPSFLWIFGICYLCKAPNSVFAMTYIVLQDYHKLRM